MIYWVDVVCTDEIANIQILQKVLGMDKGQIYIFTYTFDQGLVIPLYLLLGYFELYSVY